MQSDVPVQRSHRHCGWSEAWGCYIYTWCGIWTGHILERAWGWPVVGHAIFLRETKTGLLSRTSVPPPYSNREAFLSRRLPIDAWLMWPEPRDSIDASTLSPCWSWWCMSSATNGESSQSERWHVLTGCGGSRQRAEQYLRDVRHQPRR